MITNRRTPQTGIRRILMPVNRCLRTLHYYTSFIMPESRASYVYSIPTANLEKNKGKVGDKHKKQLKYCCIFGAGCFLTFLIIYLAVHYKLLYQVTGNCITELEDKSKNESFLMANLGEFRQKNAQLNQELKTVKANLRHTEELYATAQHEIEMNWKTIKELNEELKIAKQNLQHTEELYAKAQDKLESNLNTIKELNEKIKMERGILQYTEGLYRNAQNEIEDNLETIKDLKELKDSSFKSFTNFFTSSTSRGASIEPSTLYYLVILMGTFYYVM